METRLITTTIYSRTGQPHKDVIDGLDVRRKYRRNPGHSTAIDKNLIPFVVRGINVPVARSSSRRKA